MAFWVVVVYGGVLTYALRDFVADTGSGAVQEAWLGLAALALGTGLLWNAMRALGPLTVGSAELAWCLSTPVDRGSWLVPRFWLTSLGVVGAAALLFVPVAIVLTRDSLGWAALAAVGAGGSVAAGGTLAQAARGRARWAMLPGPMLLGGGAVIMLWMVAATRMGAALPAPGDVVMRRVALGSLPATLVAGTLARRALGQLDRAALGGGAVLAGAVVASAVSLDLTLLSRVTAARYWRGIGRVRSQPLRPPWTGRIAALLTAEARRVSRRRRMWVVAGLLALTQVAIAMTIPPAGEPARLVGAYIVGLQFAAGLAVVARSAGLRRMLGGSEALLRVTHLVVPGLAIVAWWALTAVAGPGFEAPSGMGLMAVVLAATYRGATRPPLRYDAPAVETPFGPFPVDIVRQVLRGPDVLGIAMVASVLLRS